MDTEWYQKDIILSTLLKFLEQPKGILRYQKKAQNRRLSQSSYPSGYQANWSFLISLSTHSCATSRMLHHITGYKWARTTINHTWKTVQGVNRWQDCIVERRILTFQKEIGYLKSWEAVKEPICSRQLLGQPR